MFQKKYNMTIGFTLIELVVVIAVSVLLIFLTVQVFSSFRDAQVLQGEISQTIFMINKAQSNTLNSKFDSEYGVRVNGDRLILFTGTVFASSSPTNEIYVLHPAVSISNITLSGGGLDILFNRLTGETENDGSFTISLKSDETKNGVVSTGKTGIITQN